jgi:hypothetical protein
MGAAVTGIYGLSEEEAIYLPYFVDGDGDGQKLDGANRYSLGFKKGHDDDVGDVPAKAVISLKWSESLDAQLTEQAKRRWT